MSYVIGVDGGGSQTCAVVADKSGRFISSGKSQGSNHQIIGVELALSRIQESIQNALHAAGTTPHEVDFVQYGLAGADRETDLKILSEALVALPYRRWAVVSDAWEGLRAGTDNGIGVSVVCGSGTNAVGRNAHGLEVQVGGFGYAFGDMAGGHQLALETFRAAVRSYQHRAPETQLTRELPAYLGFENMDAVYNYFLDHHPPIPLSLSLLVHRLAALGDKVCQDILASMGRELGLAANAVIEQLGGTCDQEIPIVLVGGIVQKGRSPALLEALRETVTTHFSGASLQQLDVPPVYGAVLLALDHLGIPADSGAKATFQRWGK